MTGAAYLKGEETASARPLFAATASRCPLLAAKQTFPAEAHYLVYSIERIVTLIKYKSISAFSRVR